MRSLKGIGDLTPRGGIAENQRAVWVLAKPVSSQVNSSMQELTLLYYCTREQHGVTASENVNVDEAKKVGETVLLKMAGNFSDMFSLTKMGQVITILVKKLIHIKSGSFKMEHSQLFQRLTVIALKGEMKLKN
ncbi:hypothetical protein PR048_006096, partial [Dryococelus australis]